MSIIEELPNDGELTDGWLATEGQNGSEEALTELHRRYFPRLVRLCRGYLNDVGLAEDVAQETMLRAIRFLGSFDGDRPMWPWLRVIAIRMCGDVMRSRSREYVVAELPERENSDSDGFDRVLDRITLEAGLVGLPARQQVALQLRYLDDCDRATSATLLGLNHNAFDQLLSRGRQRLAARVEGLRPVGPLVVVLSLLADLHAKTRGVRQPVTAASGSMAATISFVAASVVAGVAGSMLIAPGQLERSVVPARSEAYVTPVVATRAVIGSHRSQVSAAHVLPPQQVDRRAQVPGASVELFVSQKPLSPGNTERDRIAIETPLTTISVGGDVARGPGSGVICNTALLQCN